MSVATGFKWTTHGVKWPGPQDKEFISKYFKKQTKPFAWSMDLPCDVSVEVIYYSSVNIWELWRYRAINRELIWSNSNLTPSDYTSIKSALFMHLSKEVENYIDFLTSFEKLFKPKGGK